MSGLLASASLKIKIIAALSVRKIQTVLHPSCEWRTQAPNDCLIDLGNMITKKIRWFPLFLLLLFWSPPRITNARFVMCRYVCVRLIDLEYIIKCMIPDLQVIYQSISFSIHILYKIIVIIRCVCLLMTDKKIMNHTIIYLVIFTADFSFSIWASLVGSRNFCPGKMT